jgi:hypothetical protein
MDSQKPAFNLWLHQLLHWPSFSLSGNNKVHGVLTGTNLGML